MFAKSQKVGSLYSELKVFLHERDKPFSVRKFNPDEMIYNLFVSAPELFSKTFATIASADRKQILSAITHQICAKYISQHFDTPAEIQEAVQALSLTHIQLNNADKDLEEATGGCHLARTRSKYTMDSFSF